MRDYKSVIRGIKAMNSPIEIFNHWTLRMRKERAFWAHWWTPKWHEGRGPYITIGFVWLAIYRGY